MFEREDFLRLARELAESHTALNEAALRTAISRAYYCAYHRATEACRLKTSLRPMRHQIWDQLERLGQNHGHPVLAAIGARGTDLHRLRIQADYHNPYNSTNRRMKPLPALALDVIAQTEELLALIDQL